MAQADSPTRTTKKASRRKSPIKALVGFLGAWGCQTGKLDGEKQIRDLACAAFMTSVKLSTREIAESIQNLGRDERRLRIAQYVHEHEPLPTPLWPRSAKARILPPPSAATQKRRISAKIKTSRESVSKILATPSAKKVIPMAELRKRAQLLADADKILKQSKKGKRHA